MRNHGLMLVAAAPGAVPALLALSLLSAAPATAQASAAQVPDVPAASPAAPADMIDFSADELSYDDNSSVIVASGDVVLRREGQQLTADEVRYNRQTGVVTATGKVLLDAGNGAHALADGAELADTLRDGVAENILLVLADRSRLAANAATMANGRLTLDHAIYSPCNVEDDAGCPARPVWELKAVKVVHDPVRRRVIYTDAELILLGVPLLRVPGLSHPDNFNRSETGVLQPEFSISRELGIEMRMPWLWSIAPDRDLSVTAHFYTSDIPVLGLDYRQLFAGGPIRIGGLVTYAKGRTEDPLTGKIIETPAKFRGAIDANGEIHHGDGWQSTFSARLTNDDNFLGHYQVSLDTRLRSTYALEHFQSDTGGGSQYFAIRGWYFQNLVHGVDTGSVPVALPLIDFRWRLPDAIVGGQLTLQANSLGLYRADGQRMARALASATWRKSMILPMGQVLSLTGMARGDVYRTGDSLLADEPVYAGRDGWEGRFISLAAADLSWPFAGPLFGGVQTLTPRVQLVAAGVTANDAIPDEDSRAIDLEDSNLFALNRFPGYDRFESGTRVTYGLQWELSYPGVKLAAEIGQSRRFDGEDDLFPEGTGLSGRYSDFVGRVSLAVGEYVQLTERVRLDKDNLAVRRNEADLALGSRKTFLSLGYLRFNRHISLEDLPDHQELRAGGRLAIGRYWALTGSTILDLTGKVSLANPTGDPYQPIRHRLGITYEDECLEFGLGWKRNYIDNPNAREGNTFQFTLKLRNLG